MTVVHSRNAFIRFRNQKNNFREMSWLAKDDDDWLQDPPKDSSASRTLQPASIPIAPIDLTLPLFEEPLHSLPEAPTCPIRM